MKHCVCGYSSPIYTTFISHQKFCSKMASITEDFGDTMIINPPADHSTLVKLCEKHSIDLKKLSKCLSKKAETLANKQSKIQKPGGIGKIQDFCKKLNCDIKDVGADAEIDFLANLLAIFTSLSCVSDERVLTYFTDVSYIDAKVTYLEYKLTIARNSSIVREHDVITRLISLTETVTKKPRLERASSEVVEEVVEVTKKGFFW